MPSLPRDYFERVYAGVLGKLIGVYLGRPFEGRTYAQVIAELGEITYYVHERCGVRLVVTDDDVSGTFTFLRALDDYPVGRALTPAQVGATWLNYLILEKSVLWWGGVGNSTEHTAFVRLKQGLTAPASGSSAVNGRTMAEQIGAQIFIDGWAMAAPGDPELAAALARTAASVSHDGEAIYGAQVIAAMEALAFGETDLNKLLDTAVNLIPRDSLIYRVIADVREWRAGLADWRAAREKIAARYGYDKFPGNCHIVPNHALIHLGLLYGDDDFQKSLLITNTSGWDTDCNSGNVGCLLGIKNGLAALDAGPDWRGPVADRLYLPTADGGRAVTDALQESLRVVNTGRRMQGLAPLSPKAGARFHFEAPGAVQGWEARTPHLRLENTAGHSALGARSLAFHYRHVAPGQSARAATDVFIRPADLNPPGSYNLHASPTLYPGQTVRARVTAAADNAAPVQAGLYLEVYGAGDRTRTVRGPVVTLAPGADHEFAWRIEEQAGQPLQAIGVEVSAEHAAHGCLYLDYLTWDGAPAVTFTRPAEPGTAWQQAWVSAVDKMGEPWMEPFRPVQNEGRGLLMQGAREWQDYRVTADFKPLLVSAGGVAVRVQGLRRYYALLLIPGQVRLVKVLEQEQILAAADFPWEFDRPYQLALEAAGRRLRGWVDGQLLVEVEDLAEPLLGGAAALVVENGAAGVNAVRVSAAG